ncbi:amino acid adenylation domain-containing protein [Calothrix sp. FACHB-1219]|uniref:non-ribosomal peptide synthetase n=1 Tax=unclassified Calothrix TaxID=2619626 RepID=UPI001685EB4D|nr:MULTISPECIES: amino acid adenylation domain-containing protein [unclassified Calothrix]MBD2203724.1 amino acid adenylation domain-containing protein [Calothrix sp. FACHB-168]MBD2222055.1 amino acid adenylation domain-containing protein [Calothrix sp. FACHB-1219]
MNFTPEIPYYQIIQQAQLTPDAIAVFDRANPLTYQQLDRLSNQVAAYLRTQGVSPNTRVGIMTERGARMIIGILGILKAGGSYIPLDPAYPTDRLRYILEHATIETLLTEHQVSQQVVACVQEPLPLQTVMFLDEGEPLGEIKSLTQITSETWQSFSDDAVELCNSPDDLMVILYTSGSTGRPKGVMLNHRGYMNRLTWMQNTFSLQPGDRVAQRTSFCFDISVWEIFWTLMTGATICPVQREVVLNPWEFAQWIQQTQINVMHFVPSLFGEFISALENESWTFPQLRWLIFSGEALPMSFIQRWIDRHGLKTGLANLYGPTEASIDVTCHLINERPDERLTTQIPIGKAIDNVYLKVLDEGMQPVKPGDMGELWLGGVQLALGYLKDPQKTAKAFCPNPFSEIPGEYIYRTGDLVKELPDGTIEYHGRIDHQVKIRGFRIELGEIESVLTTHPNVREAAAIAIDYGEGQKRLVACISGNKIKNRFIKEYLEEKLPHYMIPQRFLWLDSLPKNHNGKLDRNALVAQLTSDSSASQLPLLPLGPAQRWLVKYFEPPYQWLGYTRFLYHQSLNLDIFNQALNLLVHRHPAFRTVFVQNQGQWQQHILNQPQSIVAEYWDGSQLSQEERNRKIEQQMEATAKQIQIDRWPITATIIVKVSPACYDITMIAHHMIADMLSATILFKELWSAYHQLLLGVSPTFPQPQAESYEDFMQILVNEEKKGTFDGHLEYWQSQFPDATSRFEVPVDHVKGANIEVSTENECFSLSQQQTELLLTKGKSYYGANVYPILLAPLYRLMANWSHRPGVVISHRSHGRDLGQGSTFMESMGNYAVNFPVGMTLDSSAIWPEIIQEISDRFQSVPMNGITYDWIGDRLPEYLYPDCNLTPIRANYLGNRSVAPSNLFEFVYGARDCRLSPPDQKRTTLIEFFFLVVDGRLEITIEYSRNFHLSTTIQSLGKQYLLLLEDLLNPVSIPQIGLMPK